MVATTPSIACSAPRPATTPCIACPTPTTLATHVICEGHILPGDIDPGISSTEYNAVAKDCNSPFRLLASPCVFRNANNRDFLGLHPCICIYRPIYLAVRRLSRILEANWGPPSPSLSAKPAPRFWGARESCNLRHARKGWFSRLVRPEIAPTFNGLRCQCIAIVLGENASSRMVIFIQRLGRQNLRRHYSDNHQHRVRDTREQTLKP